MTILANHLDHLVHKKSCVHWLCLHSHAKQQQSKAALILKSNDADMVIWGKWVMNKTTAYSACKETSGVEFPGKKCAFTCHFYLLFMRYLWEIALLKLTSCFRLCNRTEREKERKKNICHKHINARVLF